MVVVPQRGLGGGGDHALGEHHHVVIVPVGGVELQLGELRVVFEADALVAEVATDLVHPLIAADQQPFQIQLERDAQVKLLLELVVVGGERPRRRAAVKRLQDGRLDFQEAVVVHEAAQGADQSRSRAEDVAHLRIDGQVGVALAVALFLVGEGAIAHELPIDFLLLGHRQRADGLAEQFPGADVEADLAGAGAEHLARGLHEVAQVEQLLELVVPLLTHVVAPQEELQAAGLVGHVGEDGLAHVAHAEQPAADGDGDGLALRRGFKGGQGGGRGVAALGAQGVGINARLAQTGQLLQALLFQGVGLPTHITLQNKSTQRRKDAKKNGSLRLCVFALNSSRLGLIRPATPGTR
jgi:hypothetical protein